MRFVKTKDECHRLENQNDSKDYKDNQDRKSQFWMRKESQLLFGLHKAMFHVTKCLRNQDRIGMRCKLTTSGLSQGSIKGVTISQRI